MPGMNKLIRNKLITIEQSYYFQKKSLFILSITRANNSSFVELKRTELFYLRVLACELFPLGCILWKYRAWLHLVDPSLTRPVSSLVQCLHCVCPLYRDWTTATSHNNELEFWKSVRSHTLSSKNAVPHCSNSIHPSENNQRGWGEYGDKDVGSLSFLNDQLSAATDSSGLAHQTLCTLKVECVADIVWKL